LGALERIQKRQQQLSDFLDGAVHCKHVESLQIGAQNITKHAFPDGNWPYDLPPWPAMRIHSSQIHIMHGRWIDALMHGVRGYLSLERSTGDVWVRKLSHFLQILARGIEQFSDMPDKSPSFPTRDELWDVLYGYLHELTLIANKIFGVKAKYAQAIQAWYDACMESAGTSLPGTRAFAQRFDTAQAKLLRWVGMDHSRGIALS
jgi:hypothetical protein